MMEVDKPNVNASSEYLALDKVVNPGKEAAMAEFERRRRARALTLPTDELEVKLLLRQLGEPICLFGEEKPDRRERLRQSLSLLPPDEAHMILHKEDPQSSRKELDTETWYHEGPSALRDARIAIAKYSVPRAKQRLNDAQELARDASAISNRNVRLQETHKRARTMGIYGSQVGDNRPVSFCTFNTTGTMIATAGWSGLCNVWSVPSCKEVRKLRGHTTNASCIKFHPTSGLPEHETSVVNLASSAHDGTVYLWDLETDEPIGELEGHSVRVSRLAFHPSGRFLATCCHDNSWRLFDLEASDEVLYQEGHTKAVYDIDFQCDGALAITGGLDGYGRVWDLRTGRCIMFLEGHQKDVLTVAFAPNGYQTATGSADNTVKMWDVRMRRCIYTIPAHTSLVSKLKFDPKNGHFLLTSSYDTTLKLWTHPGWQPLCVLSGHENKIMCCDVSNDGQWMVSCGFDRTFKLWGIPEVVGK